MFCSKCGAQMLEGTAFCSACGAPAAITTAQIAADVPVAPQAVGYAPVAPAIPAAPTVAYAGFWLRFVALLIDSFILGIPLFFVIVIVASAMGISAALQNFRPGDSADALFAILGAGFILVVVLVATAGTWLYYAGFESSGWQATPGKKVLGLYVTDIAGRRISFARATGRFFGKLLSGHLTIYIGYIMAGFTEKKQALHDMIASCLVLRRL